MATDLKKCSCNSSVEILQVNQMLLKFLLAALQYNASPVSVEVHKGIYISVTDVEETRVIKLLLFAARLQVQYATNKETETKKSEFMASG